jgi:hypothetical protein
MADKISMPSSSWPTLKKIIRAYGEVQDSDKPTADDVAEIAKIQRSIISSNNKFLREIGIIQETENKPTPLGVRLVSGLSMDNGELVSEVLQEIVRNDSGLNRFVSMVRARGPMKLELLKGEIAIAGGLSQTGPTKPILDMLEEAKVIQVTDDTVRIPAVSGPFTMGNANFIAEVARSSESSSAIGHWESEASSPIPGAARIPLPLSPTRFAYIQLPEGWEPKELKKLIKILQVILGDDLEEI